MRASSTDIANAALRKLGEQRILSLDDDTKRANAMRARLVRLRDLELATHPWRFAVWRTSLPELAVPPAFGFAHAYQRPSDDLRPLIVGGVQASWPILGETVRVGYSQAAYQETAYDIFGDQIHTDMTAPLDYEYVRVIEETGFFPDMFVEVLACRMARDAAIELPQSAGWYDRLKLEEREARGLAYKVNALWRPPTTRPPGAWQTARHSRSVGGW